LLLIDKADSHNRTEMFKKQQLNRIFKPVKSNQSKIKRNLILIIMAILAVLTGYLRDTVFKTINAILRAADLEQDYFLPAFISFLQNFEYQTLVNLKWFLTLFFSLLYLILSIIIIKTLFKDSKYLKITTLTYIGVLLISAGFIAAGLIFKNSSEKMYEFARYLMGMAQSPIILMILIPTFKLMEKEINKTSNK
jgi:exosortase F-associated protein